MFPRSLKLFTLFIVLLVFSLDSPVAGCKRCVNQDNRWNLYDVSVDDGKYGDSELNRRGYNYGHFGLRSYHDKSRYRYGYPDEFNRRQYPVDFSLQSCKLLISFDEHIWMR
ncbi:hypothetical protein D915_007234 [Fasciola hepatica]|uniref:Uncharacterized protein n=1 Tax=Fasciola hepatica TaxID=6192 RepID=A0A4E0RLS8_FASHE|nr:hypothetical protein D915_007234 [Fasciola hepatica]